MRKIRTTVSVLAATAAVLAGTATSAVAADSVSTGRTAAASCTVSGAFCATNDRGESFVLYCGMSITDNWTGGGYWNNRLPRNGKVRMFGSKGTLIYTTPANYGPVRGDWNPVYSLRADC